MRHGVILYGPPASGKDTVTRALADLDPSYELFRRLKVGSGRTSAYRMSTALDVDRLRAADDVIWENRRYGSLYVIDRPELVACLARSTPVVHLGQVPAIDAVIKAVPDARWTVAYLWCPRDVAESRIVARQTGDATERLTAWDETEPVAEPGLFVSTADVPPAEAALAIHRAVTRGPN